MPLQPWHIPQRKHVPAGQAQLPLVHTRPPAPQGVPLGASVPPEHERTPLVHVHVEPV